MASTPKKTHEFLSSETVHNPDENWHFVQFYDTDAFLIDAISQFVSAGLRMKEACIVIATKPHREGLEEHLKKRGIDVATARDQGLYISKDAGLTLSKFMVEGSPDADLFSQVIRSLIMLTPNGQHHFHIFGELVALLYSAGNREAAISLEEFWNALGKTSSFSLLCAYPMQEFSEEMHEVEFTKICKQHSRVIPTESYTTLTNPDERLLVISQLQQKANSLEVVRDKHKRTEEQLQISESNYRRLFESNLIGVFISDFAGTFLDANNAFLNLLGYTREELQSGMMQRDALTPSEYYPLSQIAVQALQETGVSNTYEKEYLHKSGKRIPVLVAVKRIDQTDLCVGFVLDISERKELEKRKDEFISMASHELKTPITSLKGFLHILQQRLSSRGDEKDLQYLVRMESQVNRLTKLINDLLDISKIQTGQLIYQEEDFDLNALVREIVDNIQETTHTHKLLLEDHIQIKAFGDRDRIGQVLTNLLTNAIKYSPQADRVYTQVTKNKNDALISVQDFGIGIAKEQQQKIYERFYQVAEGKTYPGLGIGLSIANEIIKRHNGQLWVESERGKGATFYFTLPLHLKHP